MSHSESESDLIELRTTEVRGKRVTFVSTSDEVLNHLTKTRKRPLSKKGRIRKKQLRKEINDLLLKAITKKD